MDTLSVKIPTTLHHPARTQINNFFPQKLTKQTTPKVSSSSSNKSNHFIINPPPPPLLNSSSQQTTSKTPKLPEPSKRPQESHQNPSTGYAVALLDAARRHHALEPVSRDVKRLSRWLRVSSIFSGPCVGNQEKGEIVKAIVGKGNFHKYLSRLVNLIVRKSNCEVEEVLVEFGRIYDEVMMEEEGVVVLVSSGLKMETSQVLGVARRVQNISGAVRVTGLVVLSLQVSVDVHRRLKSVGFSAADFFNWNALFVTQPTANRLQLQFGRLWFAVDKRQFWSTTSVVTIQRKISWLSTNQLVVLSSGSVGVGRYCWVRRARSPTGTLEPSSTGSVDRAVSPVVFCQPCVACV